MTRKWLPMSVKGIPPAVWVYGARSYFVRSAFRFAGGGGENFGDTSKASSLKYLLTWRAPVKLQLLSPG